MGKKSNQRYQNKQEINKPVVEELHTTPQSEVVEEPTMETEVKQPNLTIQFNSEMQFKVEEKPQVEESAFTKYIKQIKESGTVGEQMVVETMEAYLKVMSSSIIDIEDIVREQTRLYGLFKNIGRREDDFRKTVVATRAYFKEYYNTVFHDSKINRGHESLLMSADDRKVFYNYLQLYKIFASVNDLKEVNKYVVISRSLDSSVVPAEVVEKYLTLVNG